MGAGVKGEIREVDDYVNSRLKTAEEERTSAQ